MSTVRVTEHTENAEHDGRLTVSYSKCVESNDGDKVITTASASSPLALIGDPVGAVLSLLTAVRQCVVAPDGMYDGTDCQKNE